MGNSTIKKVRLGEVEIAFADEGSGPAVFLLHGYPFNHSMWSEQVEILGPSHRVVTPDLRGHGQSEVMNRATMEEMARDVVGLMDRLEIPSATIGALSMGGYVTLELYRLFPDRVQALVLADTRAQGDTDEGKQNRTVQAQKALSEGMAAIAEGMLPKLLTAETIAKRPEVVQRVREMMIRTKPQGAAAALRGMAERRDQRPMLANIRVPTLIIVGEEDTLTPPDDSRQMHKAIGGSRLKIIERAAHVSNIEQPAEFNQTLLNFLGEIET